MNEPLEQAARLLPPPYRAALSRLSAEEQMQVTELRLRRGLAPTVMLNGAERLLPLEGLCPVSEETIRFVINSATDYSAYAAGSAIAEGYLTAKGGHRIGLCGTAVMDHGQVLTLKELSSVCIRVARPVLHVGDELAELLHRRQASALIIGPPGSGKTTLLRDTIRALSDQWDQRVAVVDERSELSAMHKGEPQMPLGRRTDVLCGCPKEQGIELLLRTMNPQWIALDEITGARDVEAMSRASYCGVRLLATAHADSLEDFSGRPVYRKLLGEGFFRLAWVMEKGRTGHAEELKPCCEPCP